MATSEALIKYYDCLKDSFNKIQVKDNKVALVNAALRPKIREEFIKSREVLVSYLNYIQVFTSIYNDKFSNICLSIICPLFKEHPINSENNIENNNEIPACENLSNSKDFAILVHNAVRGILKTKPELVEEYVHCVIKFFPACYNDDFKTFINYVDNSLEICSYIRGEPLASLMSKILDRINPPTIKLKEPDSEKKLAEIKRSVDESYKLIYQSLKTLEKKQLGNVAAAILAAFSRDFLTSENGDPLNYLVLYVCSLDDKLTTLFINLLWAAYTNSNRPLEERRASVIFAASFMSRAIYVDLEKVLSYLETAVIWCNDFQFECQSSDLTSQIYNETSELFYILVQSILYLITQRYREMYEKDSILRLQKMDLDKILEDKSKPLEHCDSDIEQRFREVAALYGISSLKPLEKRTNSVKKLKRLNNSVQKFTWKTPYKESNQAVPSHVRHLYRNYYDHRNFTVFRE